MTVGVGQSEIDDLYVTAVMCYHDVRWLEVTVYNLLLVYVGNGIYKFIGDPSTCSLIGLFLEEVGEGRTIDPFGNDACAFVAFIQLNHLHSVCLYNGMVLQRHKHLHFFSKQLLVGGIAMVLLLEAFQQEPPSVALGLEEVAIALGR